MPSFLPPRLRDLWRRLKSWYARIWADLRPGPEVRAGAVWGCVLALIPALAVAARYMELGFGWWADLVFSLAAAAVLMLLALAIVPLLLTILRKLPRLASGIIFGCVLIYVGAFLPVGVVLGPLVCLAAGVLGATIATWRSGTLRTAAKKKIAATALLGVLSVVLLAAIVVFLTIEGYSGEPRKPASGGLAPPPLTAANPGEPGPFRFRKLTYGTKGANPRRPEYNAPDVATSAVDAARFFKDFKGWKRKVRRYYWGYDMDRLPRNATVWLPEGPGPFALALIVHGNHGMAEFSDPGYRYLGELLASRGFILATIDENFLNSGLFHDPPKQQAVRGWMLLEHLKLWRDWSRDPRNPLGVAIDFDRIALLGHSRGGEAVATAALFNRLTHYPDDAAIRFDYGFPIRSLVAIAPVDGQYKPAGQPRVVENVHYFTIQGASDADVSSFMGSAQFDRVRYPNGGDWFKAELYLERANHGQFNTVWGRSDAGYPIGWFLNLKPLLPPEDQRRIARVYLSAFLEATLHEKTEYRALFRDPRAGKAWLPDTAYVSRYRDASYRPLAGFQEDADVTTTTAPGGRIAGRDLSVWREGRIPYRSTDRSADRAYNGLFLGWNREEDEDKALQPELALTLPEGAAAAWKLNAASRLVLSVAVLDKDAPRVKEEKEDDSKSGPDKKKDKKKEKKTDDAQDRPAPDFTVLLESAGGASASRPLSEIGLLPAPVKTQFTKLKVLDSFAYENAAEPVFQTISVPLAAFAGKGFDPANLTGIRLRFDRTASGMLLVSHVGFE